MASMFFFIPKLQFFKSLTKISVYDILTNNFNVDVKQNLKPEYCVPVKKYFEEISFYYDISNDNKKTTVNRCNTWFNSVILLYLILHLLKYVFYLIWNDHDELIRLHAGDLEQYFGVHVSFMQIPEAGVTIFPIAIFCLLNYLPVNHLNWLKVFDPIEGRQSFVNSKILMEKSAKNFIRFTLIVISISSAITQITPILICFFYMFFSFIKITLKQFILYALPYSFINSIWVLFVCTNYFASLLILIICYYYEIRLDQLDVYVNLYLKRKLFNRINRQVINILSEYTEVITEINQFNKFSSKVIFYLLLSCSSTQTFLIYNMIYVEADWILYLFYILFSFNVCSVIVVLILCTIRIASKFQRNKRNLVKLNYVKNLTIRNRIKVNLKVILLIVKLCFVVIIPY